MKNCLLLDVIQPRRTGAGARAGPEHHVQTHMALDAFHAARHLAPRQAASERTVNGFGNQHLAGGGFIARLQHVAVLAVAARHLPRLFRRQREIAALRRVENAVKQRGRIKIGHAPPVDSAVRRDERHRAAFADDGVIAKARVALFARGRAVGLIFHRRDNPFSGSLQA